MFLPFIGFFEFLPKSLDLFLVLRLRAFGTLTFMLTLYALQTLPQLLDFLPKGISFLGYCIESCCGVRV